MIARDKMCFVVRASARFDPTVYPSERAAKEAAVADRDAALARIAELEAKLRRRTRQR
jgi:hypothetical protein